MADALSRKSPAPLAGGKDRANFDFKQVPSTIASPETEADRGALADASAQSPHLDVALRLAGAGIAVFPVDPATKRPRRSFRWREESTTDPAKVRALWAGSDDAVAIDLGKSRLFVVDADRHGGPDGVAAITDLADQNGGMPAETPIDTTPNNGLHFIFANVGGARLGNRRGNLPPGIDIRGAGGYIVAPGCMMPDGRGWKRADDAPDIADAFADGTIPAVPDWLVNMIRAPKVREEIAAPPTLPPAAPRHQDIRPARESAYAAKALDNECRKVAETGKGGRNNALNVAAFNLGTLVGAGMLSRAECEAVLFSAATACGLVSDDGELAARATIKSGLDAGERKPRTPLQDAAAGQNHWPDPKPLPDGLLPVAPFDSAFLPESIAPWVADISERMQCPPDFVGAAAMVALGSVIGRKMAVRPQRKTDWFEVPNLWACIIGRPGAMKSPAMAEALKPLNRLDAQAREDNEKATRAFAIEAELHKLAKEDATKKIRAALKDGARGASAFLTLEEPEEPKARRYVVNDCTYEALGTIMADNPNGVLAFRDELVSLLKTLDREDNAAARGFFLTAWNGTGGYTFDRIIRGRTYIEAACLSLLGSTQPGRIAEYIRRASGGAGDDGLIQRFGLLVWPDQSPEWRNVDRFPDSDARTAAFETFKRLDTLDPDAIDCERDAFEPVPFLRFDNAAQGLFEEWRADLEARLRSNELSPALESHLSKYRKLVPGLALIGQVADGGGQIGETALFRALAFAEYLETHARRTYGAASEVETASAKAILSRIRRGEISDGFTARDILQKRWANLSDRDAVHAGLDLLADLDWLRVSTAQTGGRPRVTYTSNPRGRA